MVDPKTPPPRMFGANLQPLPEDMEAFSGESKTTSASSHGEALETSRAPSIINRESLRDRVIAPIEKYKFLGRDMCGRDRDLNDTMTPRLVPYEEWKMVVKNVCSQCKREIEVISKSHQSRLPGLSRETTEENYKERKIMSREFSRTRRNSTRCAETPTAPSRTNSITRESSFSSRFRTNSRRGAHQGKRDCVSRSTDVSESPVQANLEQKRKFRGSSRRSTRAKREQYQYEDLGAHG
ncbi:hypothetical protein PoB_005677300 [Plakobranchus ocellatus]|uniref:Uncharacterized protein n=1 Tax=Plakobranchus ocellatus TaxID=259542 RepID=A0AAV4CGV4_9GAST|nr:hypothetical protein PoB_005677300 [Plakobranchus ocellatus]